MDEQQYHNAQQALFTALAAGGAASVVPIRKQYVGAALCLTVIHLLDEQIASLISKDIISVLRDIEDHHYWYSTQDLHLTIKNIRSAKPSRSYGSGDIRQAIIAIQRACMDIAPLRFSIRSPICLSSSVVLKVFGMLDHRDAIHRLDAELVRAGIPDDKTYLSNDVFIGNITLCRFTEPPGMTLRSAVASMEHLDLGRYVVDSIQLVECDEVCSTASRIVYAMESLG